MPAAREHLHGVYGAGVIDGFREVYRVDITEPQRIEYVVRRQDPAVLGPEARILVTKIEVQPGDVLLVIRPAAFIAGEPAF